MPDKARMSSTIDYITIFFALWLLSGVFVDGYAHTHFDETLETFFTPWHAVLYSGFLSCALWFSWLTYRNYRIGWRGRKAIPHGYGAGVIGVLIFSLGGVGDMIWHTIFGIEIGIEALYSPSHLLLFLGGTLIVASPLKRAWVNRMSVVDSSPSFVQLLPALVSLAFATSFTAFFAMSFWAFSNGYPTQGFVEWTRGFDGYLYHYMYENGHTIGIANILITNAILIIPIVWLLKRWNPPFGSFTLMMTIPLFFMSGLNGFNNYFMIAGGLVSGLTVDFLWSAFRMKRGGWSAHLFLGFFSVLVWGLYFLIIELDTHVAWEPEFWSGAIVLAALSSIVFSNLSALDEHLTFEEK